MFLPKPVTRLLRLNMFDLEPVIALGSTFKSIIKQRRATNLKFGDLSEMLDDAIDNGLEMNDNEKVGCIMLAF